MPEWRGKDSFAAEAASFGEIDLRARAENMPVSLSMRVVSAPASFALPMVQRKVFKPAFTVRARPHTRVLMLANHPQQGCYKCHMCDRPDQRFSMGELVWHESCSSLFGSNAHKK